MRYDVHPGVQGFMLLERRKRRARLARKLPKLFSPLLSWLLFAFRLLPPFLNPASTLLGNVTLLVFVVAQTQQRLVLRSTIPRWEKVLIISRDEVHRRAKLKPQMRR